MLWNVKPVIATHIDENIVYRYMYYIAYFNKDNTWEPTVNFKSTCQISEIEQVQWVSLKEIEFLKLNKVSKKRLVSVYKKIIYLF